MPDLPEFMLKGGRPADPDFSPDERLYRRVPPRLWEDDDVALDAIEFPDMSVTRQKYGPPEAARWDDRCVHRDWGIIGFRVADIPADLPFQGCFIYHMEAHHAPVKYNYPHSEVKLFESNWQAANRTPLDRETMLRLAAGIPPEARRLWQEALRDKCQVILPRGETSAPGVLLQYVALVS
jgi:hypothetical protein